MIDFNSKPQEFIVKIGALLLAPVFAVVLMPVSLVLASVVIIRKWIYPELYYRHKSYSRMCDNWSLIWSDIHGNYDRPRWSMQVAFFDWSPSYKIEKLGDSEHGQGFMLVAWFFGIQFYITLERMFPAKWFEDIGFDGKIKTYIDRTYGWCIHHWGIWFDWASEDGGMAQWRGYDFNINFLDMIIGRHSCKFEIIGWQEDEVTMNEGSYPILIFKKNRTDRWQRWFSKQRVEWEVVVGYWVMFKGWEEAEYMDGYYIGQEYLKAGGLSPLLPFELRTDAKVKGEYVITGEKLLPIQGIMHKCKELFVPIPGKGENSYDCADRGTSIIMFGIDPDIKDYPDAARKFRQSILKTRERYGGENWMPSVVPDFAIKSTTI